MYEGLPIITNKATVEEQQGIPHHLLGFIGLDEEPWRVGLYKEKASQIIHEIRERGRLPIVVGGTHYYIQSLLFKDSLVTGQQDEEDGEDIQTGLTNQEIDGKFPILAGPTSEMIQKLREVDPVMADQWHPNDRRKIRRSLEIFLLTGKKASDIYNRQKEEKLKRKTSDLSGEKKPDIETYEIGSPLLFWIHSDSETLKNRLDSRIGKMITNGLVNEVKSMDKFLRDGLENGTEVDRSRGIWVSIGYKEYEQYLNALESASKTQPELDILFEQSVERMQAATRQYARRQIRWIRLKLMPALSDENIIDKLYLLDGTNLIDWPSAVLKPAIDLTESFLAGEQLIAPTSLSDAAKEILSGENMNASPTPPIRRECELCHTIVVSEDQWQSHLRSRAHRRLIKKGLKGTWIKRSAPESNIESPLQETP